MENNTSPYSVPKYVAEYCKGRYTEVIEYLTDEEYSKLYRKSEQTSDLSIQVLGSERNSIYIRCLVRRRVLPLTVMKNPMLLRAADLEYKTYNGEYPISIQEAKWKLISEFPETNNICQSNSCHILIRKHRNHFNLPLSDVVRIAQERRVNPCTV
jgi:hypothetical protein